MSSIVTYIFFRWSSNLTDIFFDELKCNRCFVDLYFLFCCTQCKEKKCNNCIPPPHPQHPPNTHRIMHTYTQTHSLIRGGSITHAHTHIHSSAHPHSLTPAHSHQSSIEFSLSKVHQSIIVMVIILRACSRVFFRGCNCMNMSDL